MYIKIRNTASSETIMITDLSKLDKIDKVKELILEKMKVEPGRQKLYFQGKELESHLSLYDYSVKINDTIQLMVKTAILGESQVDNLPIKEKDQVKDKKEALVLEIKDAESHFFKVGDEIDCKDADTGAWFEAVIKRITENDDVQGVDNLTYHVEWTGYEADMEEFAKVKLDMLRPRAKSKIPFEDLDIKKEIMINYNLEQPEERGFWYDAVVTKWMWSDKKLLVTIKGPNSKDIPNCQVMFTDECFKIEPVAYVTADKIRSGFVKCSCKGVDTKKCYKCGCRICAGQDNPDELIMCDDCDVGYHIKCLGMPKVPEQDEWFCPLCKRDVDIVGVGGSKQMAKKKSGSDRDWGKGMACQGRTKKCDKVDPHHFGPIPGIMVGQSWLYRLQASEEGVHRPPVGGIAGKCLTFIVLDNIIVIKGLPKLVARVLSWQEATRMMKIMETPFLTLAAAGEICPVTRGQLTKAQTRSWTSRMLP